MLANAIFPTDGDDNLILADVMMFEVREPPKAADLVRVQNRQYSLDERGEKR